LAFQAVPVGEWSKRQQLVYTFPVAPNSEASPQKEGSFMSRTKAVVILAALGCASFLLTSTSLVWASNQWYCWHWDHTSIGVSNLASGYWGSIIGSEINDWNAGTCLTFTGGSEIFVDADFYGNTGWLGIAQILDNNGCVILQAQALINQTYHDGPAYPEADDRHTTCQ
jgi:hypothetical protein